jgi:RHS repeat-associated protein
VEAVDDHGHATETRYDGLGRVLTVLAAAAFPFTPRPEAPREGRNSADYVYDPEGNRLEILETEWGADRGGGVARRLAPQSFRTTFAYDALNRRVETRVEGRVGSPPLGWVGTASYDSRGNPIQETDPTGRRTRRFFDGLNRLVRVESGYLWDGRTERVAPDLFTAGNPDGRIVTAFEYDADGRRISRTDDAGRVTRYRHDAAGRPIAVVRPDGSEELTRFDRDGLPARWELRHVGGAVLRVDSIHDSLHHLVRREVDPSAAPMFAGSRLQLFEYDGAGDLVRAVAAGDPDDTLLSSEVRRRFDSLGSRVSETQTTHEREGSIERIMSWEVRGASDGTGLRGQLVYPDGRQAAFHHDEIHRLESLVDSYTGITRFDYLGPARLLNRFLPNGTRLTFLASADDPVGAGYDPGRRIVHLRHQGGAGEPMVEFEYRLDAAGNRQSARRIHEPAGPGWMGESFGYDGVSRLIARWEGVVDASGAPAGSATDERSYVLDGPGNWTAWRRGGVDYPNQVNSLDQYPSFRDPSGRRTLGYDPAGNLSSERLPGWMDRQYAYDSQSRLVMFLDPGANLFRYRYDALGRRIAKTRNGALLARYVYDGPRLIEERDAAGGLLASYLHGAGADPPLARRRWSGGTAEDLYYHPDVLGSVVAVSDASGEVVERYRYDAYGEAAFLAPDFTPRSSSSVLNPFLFAGRPRDPESGHYDFRARIYSPALGRFLQRDPLGDPASPNLYAYAADNPVNATDPTGLFTLPAAGGINPALRQGWSLIQAGSTGWDLSRRMQYRTGSHVRHSDARFADFEQAQSAEDHDVWLENENAEWQAKEARQHAVAVEHLKKLLAMVAEQLQDPLNQRNLEAPARIEINVYGINQDYRAEQSGEEDRSELDTASADDRAAGTVTLDLNGDDLAAVARFTDTARAALGLIAGVVQSVTGRMCGEIPVVINGFSRGGGGAVDIANRLAGTGDSGSAISLRLIDAFMDRDSNRVFSESVRITTWESRDAGWINAATHVGAWFLGLSRGVYQGHDPGVLTPLTLPIPHTLMDTYVPGVLGTPGFLGY